MRSCFVVSFFRNSTACFDDVAGVFREAKYMLGISLIYCYCCSECCNCIIDEFVPPSGKQLLFPSSSSVVRLPVFSLRRFCKLELHEIF